MEPERYVPNGTPLNDYERELLTILAEECNEVAIACSKLLRFGKENRPPSEGGDGHSNSEHLSIEYGHVSCVVSMAIEERILDPQWIAEGRRHKAERLKRYMQTDRPGVRYRIRANQRPENFNSLSPAEQWEIDKRLGILDWDGK